MTLTIELTRELERRLEAEAARRGKEVKEFVRTVLEEWLSAHQADTAAAFLATLPRPSPEEVQALLRAHGAKPVERFEDLLGEWSPDDGDEAFNVHEFLEARRQWQWEGAPA